MHYFAISRGPSQSAARNLGILYFFSFWTSYMGQRDFFIYSVSWNPSWREKSHLKSFCYILAYFLQYVIFQLLWVNRKHHYKGKITYYKNMKKWGLEIGAASAWFMYYTPPKIKSTEINILQKFYSEMLIEYKWKLRIFISRGTRPSSRSHQN